MLSSRSLKRLFCVLGPLLIPVSLNATPECQEFRKQVKVDGDPTWYDADDAASAPTQVVGGGVRYRFILKNCTSNKTCREFHISDPDLDIDADLPGLVLEPGERKFVNQNEPGFENLDQPDRCDTPGIKINKATETTIQGQSNLLTFMDEAYLNCEGGPPTASLGDRIWEDLDGDGIQDCTEGSTPPDDILGNAGDTGPECDAGIPDILVDLLDPGVDGNCNSGDETLLQQTPTDANGFYLFDNLDPGNYCVRFRTPPDDFCQVGDIALGSPLFTLQNVGGDNADSDADPTTGQTGNIPLEAGDVDLSNDAGIVCPAKIGNRVWEDDGDGIQEPGEDDIGGVKVSLFECGPDMMVGGGDDVFTGEMRTTDDDGMYMFGGEPGYSLPPDKYYVVFDPSTYPPGYTTTTPNLGGDDVTDSDCLPPDGNTVCTDLRASKAINLDRDCGLKPPPPPTCDLVLDKRCNVAVPPTPDFDKCKGKLQQFTVIWTGGDIEISGLPNDSDGTVVNGQEVTFFGPFDDNDVSVDISGAANGQSEFHMSCSDDDFNDPSDCGKAAGNGKGSNRALINAWKLEGFIDAEGRVLDCTAPDDGMFTDSCSFVKPPAPSCETTGKPDNLTWRYDGGSGSCDASTFDVQSDFECTGTVNTAAQVTVTPDEGGSILVDPDEEFTISLDASKEIALSNGGGTQNLAFHTSCSQPIEAGLTAGALTLVALDGQTGGADVTYQYLVTNNGDPLTEVFVTDNLLGDIGGPINLGTGGDAEFTRTTRLFETTVNVGTASGKLSDDSQCSPASASDTVTVDVVIPTCDVSIELYKIEDKKIKWKLSNPSGVDATIDTLTVSWPGSEDLKKVKYDGSEILKDDLRSPPSTVIVSSDWLKEPKDRRVEAGDSGKKLEIEFTDDFPLQDDQPSSDFSLGVTFEEGCSVSF